MKLSIIKPLFIDKYNINVINSLYKICPIYPYQCVLHLWRFKTPIFYNNLYINYYKNYLILL